MTLSFLTLPVEAAKLKINIGSIYPAEGPVHLGLVKFKEIVQQRSKGEIEAVVHTDGAKGDERDILEGMSAGGLEAGAVGSADAAIFFPKWTVYEAPFVLRDLTHFWKFWNGPIGTHVNTMVLTERGVLTAGIVYRGARFLTANRPVHDVAEVKGLKLRLPDAKAAVKVWESMGTVAVTIPAAGVYASLRAGTADAQESPLETIWADKLFEVQKYCIATRHVQPPAKYQMSKRWLDTVNSEHRQLVLDAWRDAAEFANAQAVEFEKKRIAGIQEKGVLWIEPDLPAFYKAAQPALTELNRRLWQPGLYAKVQALE